MKKDIFCFIGTPYTKVYFMLFRYMCNKSSHFLGSCQMVFRVRKLIKGVEKDRPLAEKTLTDVKKIIGLG